MRSISAILFDWDGTLLDSYPFLDALQEAAPDIIFPDAGHLPTRFGPRSSP